MNRRNFLKLFGLLAIPSSALAIPVKPDVKVQKGMVVVTIDVPLTAVDEQYRVDTGYIKSEWIDFCPTTRNTLSSSNAFYCGSDKEITVEFDNGDVINFEPEWDATWGEFDSITMYKHSNGIDIIL